MSTRWVNVIAMVGLLGWWAIGPFNSLYAGEGTHVKETIKHAREGLNHEKEAIKHLEASVKASNDPHAKEALEHAKEAVKHAEESLGHAELASARRTDREDHGVVGVEGFDVAELQGRGTRRADVLPGGPAVDRPQDGAPTAAGPDHGRADHGQPAEASARAGR